jgi:hypothetical protein
MAAEDRLDPRERAGRIGRGRRQVDHEVAAGRAGERAVERAHVRRLDRRPVRRAVKLAGEQEDAVLGHDVARLVGLGKITAVTAPASPATSTSPFLPAERRASRR